MSNNAEGKRVTAIRYERFTYFFQPKRWGKAE